MLLLAHPRRPTGWQPAGPVLHRHLFRSDVLRSDVQDSSPLQIRLVSQLQAGRGQLTVVGDDAQSIYAFRGATNAAFTQLARLLPDDPFTQISLRLNYRSVPALSLIHI